MSYNLEFYSLDWSSLESTLGSGDEALYQRIHQQEILERFPDATEQQNEKDAWEKALHMLLMQPVKRPAATEKVFPTDATSVTEAQAQALASIVRALGRPVGALSHRSPGGDYFRNTFLLREAQTALTPPVPFALLLTRPLLGMIHLDSPTWGGLTRAEIAHIVEPRTLDDLPRLASGDSASLLFDLWDILSTLFGLQTDAVTLYF